MSSLTRWNPLRELEDIHNRLSPWFGRIGLRGFGDEPMTVSEWAPLVDITEDDKEYLIKAELPEVKNREFVRERCAAQGRGFSRLGQKIDP